MNDPAATIRAIWNSNRDEIMSRVALLEDAVTAVIEGRLSVEDRSVAEGAAHKLAGTAGTFGFRRASEAARELEGILAGTYPIPVDRTLAAADEVVALRADLSRDPAPATLAAGGAACQDPPAGPRLAIAVASRRRGKQLDSVATDAGFQPQAIAARGELSQEGPPPVAALIELAAGSDSLDLIANLAALDPPVPSLALTPPDVACDRVAAARAGARGFLSSAASPGKILTAVQRMLAPPNAPDSTVLVLDQGPERLPPVRAALREAGLRVVGLDDPAQFWEVLAETQPDLVILGTGLPGVDGAELCRVLRSDAGWAALPVLLLSARGDRGAVAALFAAGADDVVTEPFAGPELAGRVRNRIERARMLRASVRPGRDEDAPAVGPGTTPAAGPVAADYDVDVVVVEDDPLLADLLRHALTTRGHRFRHFTDGQAAADQLTGKPPALRPRVVLLDVDLPVLNGFGVLRQMALTESLAATRVIMLTAHSSEKEIVNALELGAFDHVAKPFSVPVLMHRVQRAMGD